MVGSSKTLTVSYGTFSCTLEGFDEPVGTMTAIVAYLIELAADDRCFDGGSPTPDPDTLARIAGRRVEAHVHEGRLVLRAQADTPTGQALAAAPPADPARAAGATGAPKDQTGADREPGADAPPALRGDEPAVSAAALMTSEGLGDHADDVDPSLPAPGDAAPGADKTGTSADDGQDAATSLCEDTLATFLAEVSPADMQAAEAGTDENEASQAAANDAPSAGTGAGDQREHPRDAGGARVLKVSRAEVEAARAGGLLDALDEDEAGEHALNALGDEDSALNPDEEAALQRDLARLDSDPCPETAADGTAASDAAAAVADQSPEPGPQAAATDGTHKEVSRIFDETDRQMADPGLARRRNAIQHLRAALAATRAETAAGADIAKPVDASPYRGDLDAAVRPRRTMPAPDAPRSARPAAPHPSPLKLVDEQRVDTPRGPVRPRRVATPGAEVAKPQETEFSAFARELGVTQLPDLLEAAATYLADVEGHTRFSRPMLIGKLREISDEHFSREDSLRSFGELLREGKLQKIAGGRFAVTATTGFRTAAQRRGC